MTATRLTSPVAFALGFLLTLVPTFGPFLAIGLVFTQRWQWKRRDLLWAAAAGTLALPSLALGEPLQALAAIGSVAGPWLVFRAFYGLKGREVAPQHRHAAVSGLLVGYAAVIVFGLTGAIASLDLDAALTIPRAIVWEGSPALFAHSVLVMGAIIALLAREQPRVASTALGLAAAGVLISGSREAAIAWVVLAGLQIAVRDADSRRPRAAEAVVLSLMLVIAAGLAPVLGWGRVGFLLSSDTGAAPTPNLLTGTELAGGDWWDDRWVDVVASDVTIDGRTLTAYEVRKEGEEGWLRLQQLVRLTPGTTYTLSGWIEDVGEAVPGLHGWARLQNGADAFVMTSTLRDGAWSANVTGPGELVAARELDRVGAWRRLAVTFHFASEAPPATWFVGFAPDTRPQPGEASRVAGLQLEQGATAGPYVPGAAGGGLSFDVARAPLWNVAGGAVLTRPLFGWGEGAFPQLYLDALPGEDRVQIVPAHPHNQLLGTLVEKGVVGLIGLGLLLVALFGLTVRYRDLGFLSVVVVALLLASFDGTLLYGGVIYPLAAAAGWRSARRGVRRNAGVEAARQATVRVVLALADAAAALLALLLAQRLAADAGVPFVVPPLLGWAVFLWPMFALREGLLPGYGLTPAQELKRQVAAGAAAWLLFAVVALLTTPDAGGAVLALPLQLALALLLAPATRAGTKRLLHAMRMWGRPVVILGAGATGRRVVKGLLRTPLDGLHPVGVFDDDPALRCHRLHDTRVRGTLDDALAFARRHQVGHAIVTIPTLDAARLDALVNGSGRVFRRVQFVPALGSIPSDDVIASDLDGMLALEVRNGLFDPANRGFKRAVDLVATVAGGALALPLLVLLWAWVRSDSPGGAFHRSERLGQDGRPFACLKFRTMHVDAEERLARLLETDAARRVEYETWHKLEDDPRVTRVGRFLRRTSLDELPQLWNVLMGQMSLVGPRPYLARERPDIGGYASIIFQAKPGMTGHWQVNGRSEVTFEERLRMEAHYVRNWSIWWDVILLTRTPVAVVKSRGSAK